MKLSEFVQKYGDVEVISFTETMKSVKLEFNKQAKGSNLTDFEKAFLKKAEANGYKWIAREISGDIWVCVEKPFKDTKNNIIAAINEKYVYLDELLGKFTDVTYDNSPMEITDLIGKPEKVNLTNDEIAELYTFLRDGYTTIAKDLTGEVWVFKPISLDSGGIWGIPSNTAVYDYKGLGTEKTYQIKELLEENK